MGISNRARARPTLESVLDITVAIDAVEIVVSLIFDSFPQVDRERRLTTSFSMIRRGMLRSAGTEIGHDQSSIQFRFEPDAETQMRLTLKHLEERLPAVLFAPLMPKAVDQALGITTHERLRWYKDGRLPTCGRGRIGQGEHTAQFPLFPFREIARLQANAHLIATWRQEDSYAGQQAPGESQPPFCIEG